MKIHTYYQIQAQEQFNAEVEIALSLDRQQEMRDEAKYWAKVDADDFLKENYNNWNIN